MAMMAEKLKERGTDLDQERVRREIKMAMLMKVKQARQQAAAESSNTSGFSGFKQGGGIMSKADEWR
jgi:arginine repressor